MANFLKMIKDEPSKIDLILVFIFGFYCFFGESRLAYIYHINADYLSFLLIFIAILLSYIINKRKRIDRSVVSILALLYCISSGLAALAKDIRTSYAAFAFICVSFLFLFFLRNKENLYKLIINILFFGGLFFASTVILQEIYPTIIDRMRSVLFYEQTYERSLNSLESQTNYHCGLAPSSVYAAFFICIFNVITIAKLATNQKIFTNSVLICLGIIALLFTQKRMLFLGFLFTVLLTFLLCKKSLSKKIKFLTVACLLSVILARFVLTNIQASQIFIDRMFHNENFDSGRSDYYAEMFEWILAKPMLGVGLGTADEIWGFGGHNCYIQKIAETGIVGFIWYFSIIGFFVYNSVVKLTRFWNDELCRERKEELQALLTSTMGVFLILVYAMSGNPFYDYQYCLTFYVLLAIPFQVPDIDNSSDEQTCKRCRSSI